jgi:hypothetical protein
METRMTSVVTLPLIVLLATPPTDGAVPGATDAEQLYAKAREVDADDPFREHHEMAVKAWTAFVATDAPPDEKRDAYLRLAESHLALNDPPSALESIEHAIRLGLETAKAHCLRGTILIRQGSREAAPWAKHHSEPENTSKRPSSSIRTIRTATASAPCGTRPPGAMPTPPKIATHA